MLRGGFGSVESLGKARNLAGGLLPMDDALGGGLIQRRGGGAQELRSGSLIISLDGGANRFHHILDAGLDGTIASSALHALLMTLDSRLVLATISLRGTSCCVRDAAWLRFELMSLSFFTYSVKSFQEDKFPCSRAEPFRMRYGDGSPTGPSRGAMWG